MGPDHFERALRAFQKRVPFRSFTVSLVNGDRVQVDHPEAIVIRAGVAVFIAADGTPTLFDSEGVNAVTGETPSKESA